MKRALCLTILAVGGCAMPLPPNGRLEPNDALRAVCAEMTTLDVELRALLSTTEGSRLRGISYEDILFSVVESCDTDACALCGIAVVDQVYSR
jgi:hypothetical protein